MRLPNRKLKQVTTTPPYSAHFRFPITPYRENNRVDSNANDTPNIFRLLWNGLMIVRVPMISKIRAAT